MKVPGNTMIDAQDFAENLYQLMGETFEKPTGIYLDRDTALFQTLETVTAAQASLLVGNKCASQVAHVTFYIESFERYALQNDTSPRDWGEIWSTVEKVTPEEWGVLKEKLRRAY